MDTTTINGLHSCKPGNEPIVGQVKLFVIQHMTSKKGKPYIKIKSANEENGGTPHRILQADKTDFVDQHGNVSYNMEVEASSSQPTAFNKARETMQQGEPEHPEDGNVTDGRGNVPEQPLHPLVKRDEQIREMEDYVRSNGVTDARKHLMQSANLYNLCVDAVDKAIAPWMPEVARTSEQFQAAVASLFIEASKEQWWSGKIVKPSLVDSMPTTPIKK